MRNYCRRIRRYLGGGNFQKSDLFSGQRQCFKQIGLLIYAIYCYQIYVASNALYFQSQVLEFQYIQPPWLLFWFRFIPFDSLSYFVHFGYILFAVLVVLNWKSIWNRIGVAFFATLYQGLRSSVDGEGAVSQVSMQLVLLVLIFLPDRSSIADTHTRIFRQHRLTVFWWAQFLYLISVSLRKPFFLFGGWFREGGISAFNLNAFPNLFVVFSDSKELQDIFGNMVAYSQFFAPIFFLLFFYLTFLPLASFRQNSFITWGVLLVIQAIFVSVFMNDLVYFSFYLALFVFCSPFCFKTERLTDRLSAMPILRFLKHKGLAKN